MAYSCAGVYRIVANRFAETRLQLAELLLEQYPDEKSEVLEHLNFAIKEFYEMKMKPSLERALRHKEILGAWNNITFSRQETDYRDKHVPCTQN